MKKEWVKLCEMVQDSLITYFWDESNGIFANHYPEQENEVFIYWWHAHGIDVLLDGYLRSKDIKYLRRIENEFQGVYKMNGNTCLHNWYDDMEWMALALLRLWDVTKEYKYLEQVQLLWKDIKTAWNDTMGGGLAWRKDQLYYKNTPANGPAAILAYRLYIRFSDKEDFKWGNEILDWNINCLMDPETSFIWDGMNRLGDGKIDYDWKFTYCQGVIIGALIERYEITKDEKAIAQAVKIARTAIRMLSDSHQILNYEGEDDCGLFKGIFVRYLCQLVILLPELEDLKEFMLLNAVSISKSGMNEDGLISGYWNKKTSTRIDLAQHLSGIMMLEMASILD